MLDTLVTNALSGLVSVFSILLAFLGKRLAFWVSIGLPFSFKRTFVVLPFVEISINSVTLMSLYLTHYSGRTAADGVWAGWLQPVCRSDGYGDGLGRVVRYFDFTAATTVFVRYE